MLLFGQLFCCDEAQSVRMLILEEERALADAEVDEKIDVRPHPPFMSNQQKMAAKERAEQRFGEDLSLCDKSVICRKNCTTYSSAISLVSPPPLSLILANFRLKEFELQRVQKTSNQNQTQNRFFPSGELKYVSLLCTSSYYLNYLVGRLS